MEMVNLGSIMDFAYFSIALLVAFLLRNRLPFLQKLLIPSCIIAGVLILLCGPLGLKFFPLSGNVETYVYHLLTAVFAALALRGFRFSRGRDVLVTTSIMCKGLAFQAVLGVLFTIAWIALLLPSLFPGFGMQLMLGFGYDYNIALNFGMQWERLGFVGGRLSGFSFGLVGFLTAYILGIVMINWGRRRNLIAAYSEEGSLSEAVLSGLPQRDKPGPEAGRMTTTTHSIESLTVHLAVICAVMLLTYLFINVFVGWLKQLSPGLAQFGEIFWMLNFLFAVLIGTLVRRLMELMQVDHLLDRGMLARACGVLVDYAVVAAIAAIPVIFIAAYWIEVVTLSVLGAAATFFLVLWLSRKLHRDYHLERAVSAFGVVTGNISSGLALLRAVDPEMKSPVAEDLAYAGGAAFIAGVPLLFLMNLPLTGLLLGEPVRYLLITLAWLAGYIALVSLVGIIIVLRRRAGAPKEAKGQQAK